VLSITPPSYGSPANPVTATPFIELGITSSTTSGPEYLLIIPELNDQSPGVVGSTTLGSSSSLGCTETLFGEVMSLIE
jgi:hypothetical protein